MKQYMKNALNELFKDAEAHFKNIHDTYELLEKTSDKKISVHSARSVDFR